MRNAVPKSRMSFGLWAAAFLPNWPESSLLWLGGVLGPKKGLKGGELFQLPIASIFGLCLTSHSSRLVIKDGTQVGSKLKIMKT